MDEAETLCDRLALIHRGAVRALDTPEAIAARAGVNRLRFTPSRPVDDQTLYGVRGVQLVERKERYLTVTGTGDLASAVIKALAAKRVKVSELEARRGNLDDAFIKLTRDTDAPIPRAPGGVSGARPTNEVFVDPETGRLVRVWFDEHSGRREYHQEEEAKA
jgi:hypothetical protein